MHYTQNTNPNSSKITENQWGLANRLNFSTFTSCIGIVGYDKKNNGVLWGIHLVQVQDDFFNNTDAGTVTSLVSNYCEKNAVQIFGCIAAWKTNPSYNTLKKRLTSAGFQVEEVASPKDDGTYTATYNTITSTIDIVKS